jgi:hypothetical protein
MNDAGKIAMTFWLSSLSRASAASKRAAAKLGVSQPAFSHTIRGLEARLGLRLLARTDKERRGPRSG